MNLLELQRRMERDVRRPLTRGFEMQPTAENGQSMEANASAYIKPNAQLTSFERLEIYNRQYWLRVMGVVTEDYPALQAVLGPRKFDALLLAYLRETPSTSWTLRDLSGKMPGFLISFPDLGGRKHRLAVDVARLEWAYVESFDGRQFAPLTADDIQTIGPESRVSLQPHIRLLDLWYSVDELVLAVHHSIPESDIASNAATERKKNNQRKIPQVKRQRIYLVVHRFDNSVYYRRIERETFLLLGALRDGKTITEAIVQAFAKTRLSNEEQANLLRESFAHASELGWLCSRSQEAEERSDLLM